MLNKIKQAAEDALLQDMEKMASALRSIVAMCSAPYTAETIPDSAYAEFTEARLMQGPSSH